MATIIRAQINYPLYFRDFNHLQKHSESQHNELQTWSEGSPNITSRHTTFTKLPGEVRWVLSRQGLERVVHIRIYHMRTVSCKQLQSLGQVKKYKLHLHFQWILLGCSAHTAPGQLHYKVCILPPVAMWLLRFVLPTQPWTSLIICR